AAKGGGSENKAHFAMLNPSDSLVDWVLETVPKMGAGWCPPGILGIGVGGSADKAMLLAKESLSEPLDMLQLLEQGPQTKLDELRLHLYERINDLGIGAQGLGGLSTVLDVKIKTFPTHAASKPVALIPNCAATRHVEFVLDGTGPAELVPPAPESWMDIERAPAEWRSQRVDLDSLTSEQVTGWQSGEILLLSGGLWTGQDAAHKRIQGMVADGMSLRVDFTSRVIYSVGLVDPVR